MKNLPDSLSDFVAYRQKLKGDEKGEAQIFLDHLFMAFGHEHGLRSAGATCEFRIKKEEGKRGVSFADLVWKPRVLVEMKKAGEDLSLHYQQAFGYWQQLVPNRPRYVVLCNFDEFWIYDFDTDIYKPIDKISLASLPEHAAAFGFLLPVERPPVFQSNRKDITKQTATHIAGIFLSMTNRGIAKNDALRYCMQCVIAMFAEDVELLPDLLFTRLIKECRDSNVSSYDLVGGLFREMNTVGKTPAGRYAGVDYFNGGLFDVVQPLELRDYEIERLYDAARHDWESVNPAIFGTMYEKGMDKGLQHMQGAHYTSEQDIKRIVTPVIVTPWQRKIDDADSLDEFYDLLRELRRFRVLDPACGSGNFLFIAYKEMKLLERQLLFRIREKSTHREDARRLSEFLANEPYVSTKQFFGMDKNDYAVELAKVTLMIAKEISLREHGEDFDTHDEPLPLDNLDQNIVCADALFTDWQPSEAIIGNPPYQSKNKMQQEFGAEYMDRLRNAYPEVPGRADFCVYWFYKAHQHLPEGCYAGLVGTNTIRQNYSREGSLDFIVKNGGTIVNAVSSQIWPGEANLHVSIVSWKKGAEDIPKALYVADEKGQLVFHEVLVINSSLTLKVDVAGAKTLDCNKHPKVVFQGQTHGHEGFLLSANEAKLILKQHTEYEEVLKVYLTGDELLSNFESLPNRFIIDFTGKDIMEAAAFKQVFKIIEARVLPERKARAEEQIAENQKLLTVNPKAKTNKHHLNFFNSWWKLSYGREDMFESIVKLTRYISCSRVTKRPIFEFIHSGINPNDALMVFAFEDDYSFGIIHSGIHFTWFQEKCSTLKGDYRYTTDSVWDTFPFPQSPTKAQVFQVAKAAKALRDARNEYLQKHHFSLRDLYRLIEQPGKNPLKDLHRALDEAVLAAYSFPIKPDDTDGILQSLLALNFEVAAKEERGEAVQPPGLPRCISEEEKGQLVTEDCVRWKG